MASNPHVLIDSPPHDSNVRISGNEARHLGQALRARPGFRFTGFNGDGKGWLCEITSIEKGSIESRIVESLPDQPLVSPAVTIAISPIKGQRMDRAIEKAAELGAARIIPMLSRYTVVKPTDKRLERWGTITLSAVKQSRRFRMPELLSPLSISEALSLGVKQGEVWVLDTAENSIPIRAVVDSIGSIDRLTLLVGPEGGFSPEEGRLFAERQVKCLSLGSHPLRTETAVAVSLGIINCLGVS